MPYSFQGWKPSAVLCIAMSFFAMLAKTEAVADESVPSSIKGAPATHKQKKS